MNAQTTPSDDGFSMPAEWSLHSECYISWPCREQTWHGHYAEAKAAYANVIRAIGRFEQVRVLAAPSTVNEARKILGQGFNLIKIELNDSWFRDNGPIFVRNKDDEVAIVKFKFNAWGNKFPPYDKDDLAPITLATQLGMRCYIAPMVLEGGSIGVDGEGTLIATEQCLLNPNRNPNLSREQIEHALARYLGIRKVIWLGRGVEGDLTDGHVDGVACFAGNHLVLAAHTNDRFDPNYDALQDNIARLESSTDAKGRSIEVVRIAQPHPREVDGIPITPGYTNHYIANEGIVVPTYGIPEDDIAIKTLMSAYPNREVVGVDCSYIEIGGGAVHCITQQRPNGNPAPP